MMDRETRLDQALDMPWDLMEYERWVAEQRPGFDDYLFAEARSRFEPQLEDRLYIPDDLEAVEDKGRVVLRSAQLGGGVTVEGVRSSVALRLLALFDGQRSLAEVRLLAGSDRAALDRLLNAALGSLIFAPEAISELEERLSGVELVRFVGTPYEIVRGYWRNMADVRSRAKRELDAVENATAFCHMLRRLHVVALLGDDFTSFYRPASRITRQGIRPGALYETPTKILRSQGEALIVEGPRVGVALMGGAAYQRLLCEKAGDPEALAATRALASGLSWGERLTGRAPDEREALPWFCPPRPLQMAHWEQLFEAFRAALTADSGSALDPVARFHWRFVRMHPFRCANQSLSMNLVNLLLERQQGVGIPHLLLDQLALRLNDVAYARVFRQAVLAHSVIGTRQERWAGSRERKNRAYGLIQRLQQTAGDAHARQIAEADPDAAACALICP